MLIIKSKSLTTDCGVALRTHISISINGCQKDIVLGSNDWLLRVHDKQTHHSRTAGIALTNGGTITNNPHCVHGHTAPPGENNGVNSAIVN